MFAPPKIRCLWAIVRRRMNSFIRRTITNLISGKPARPGVEHGVSMESVSDAELQIGPRDLDNNVTSIFL